MFAKLHLLSQDVPEGGDGFRWRAHPYLRMAGTVPKGPVVFDWNPRQRGDLEALWRDPTSDGARERLAKDLAVFCDKLGWAPDGEQLEDAEKHGDEYMLTLSSVPLELYVLPWEVIQVGASGTYLSDYASAQVRYSMPGLGPRELETVPAEPGVLFAWSAAGGPVPHEEQAAAIRSAAEAGGVSFRELAEVDEAGLQAALDAGPPSVLHLLCHGLPGGEGEPSRLRWGPSDRPSEITAPRLARMLRTQDSIRLVVLSTCGGGDGHGDPMLLGSLAQELHRKGIPSVVASRYPLSVAGSRVMTRALYDKLLREAWSLERALRHTRQTLFRVDEDGEAHPGDAYGIQLYAYDTEWFVSDNEVEAERPVLASYPFGTPARPVPASGPPPAELSLTLEKDPPLPGDELVDRLRKVAEDEGLVVVIQSSNGDGPISVVVHTTVDGAQRLLGAWRSKALQVAVGVIVGALVLTKGISAALGGTLSASVAQAAAAHLGEATSHGGAAASHVGHAASHGGAAAGHASAAAGQGGVVAGQAGAAAGQAGAAAGQTGVAAGQAGVAAGQAGVVGPAAASAGKAATVVAFAGKAVTAKLAIAAMVSSAAVAGGAVLYHAETRPAVHSRYEPQPSTPPSSVSPMAKVVDPQRGVPTGADPGQGAVVAIGSSASSGTMQPGDTTTSGGTGGERTAQTGTTSSGATTSSATTDSGGATTNAAPSNGGTTANASPGAGTTSNGGMTANASPSTDNATRDGASSRDGRSGTGGPSTRSGATSTGRDATSGAAGPGTSPQHPGGAVPSGEDSTGDGGDATADSPDSTRERDDATAATGTGAGAPARGAEASDAASRAVCGNRIQEADEQCDDGNTRDGDGCSSQCLKEIAIAPESLMAQLRTGNRNVDPSDETKASLRRHPDEDLTGTVSVCVSTTGVVTKAVTKDGSGYEEYDNKLLAAVRMWRYRPYLSNGKPAPVCSTVVFVYHQHR